MSWLISPDELQHHAIWIQVLLKGVFPGEWAWCACRSPVQWKHFSGRWKTDVHFKVWLISIFSTNTEISCGPKGETLDTEDANHEPKRPNAFKKQKSTLPKYKLSTYFRGTKVYFEIHGSILSKNKSALSKSKSILPKCKSRPSKFWSTKKIRSTKLYVRSTQWYCKKTNVHFWNANI